MTDATSLASRPTSGPPASTAPAARSDRVSSLAAVTPRAGGARRGAPALVFATIHRRAIDLARRQDRRANREIAALGLFQEAWFDSSVEDRELQQLIQGAMSRMSEDFREVVTLKVWGGLTFSEIAVALGIPANTASSRYRYGIAELRRLTKEVLA